MCRKCSFTVYVIDDIKQILTYNIKIQSNNKIMNVASLWDTGAATTCISKNVVKTLNLTSNEEVYIDTPSGRSKTKIYEIDIILPNEVYLKNIKVYETTIGDQGFDLLIGMDIIIKGDFCVSGVNGVITASFRYPVQGVTDYMFIGGD